MKEKFKIRLWFYPIKSKCENLNLENGFHCNEDDKNKNIDIVFDDNFSDLKNLISDENLNCFFDNSIYESVTAYIHKSSEKDFVKNYFIGKKVTINCFSNGNKWNNSTYATLYEILETI